jgi:hypothetical protein
MELTGPSRAVTYNSPQSNLSAPYIVSDPITRLPSFLTPPSFLDRDRTDGLGSIWNSLKELCLQVLNCAVESFACQKAGEKLREFRNALKLERDELNGIWRDLAMFKMVFDFCL